jgi:hypothetical protein
MAFFIPGSEVDIFGDDAGSAGVSNGCGFRKLKTVSTAGTGDYF